MRIVGAEDRTSECPVVVREADRKWETWPEEQGGRGGRVRWKTLLSSDITNSSEMTAGILVIPVSESLEEHSHAQAELYLILEGEGLVRAGGEPQRVKTGSVVFIPGSTPHSCVNTGIADLRIAYVFPVDSFAEVEYIFE